MKVLSFNVLAQVWVDNELRRLVPKKYLNVSYRVKKQLNVIKSTNADIIFLQEITPRVLKLYMKKLRQYKYCYAPTDWKIYCGKEKGWRTTCPTDKTPPTGNAILWRSSLFRKVKCSTIVLDKIRSNRAVRMSAILKSGKQVHFICVHLAHGDRQVASEQFRRIFKGHIRNHRRVIIAGDFNMGIPNMPIMSDIRRRGFTDHTKGLKTHPFYYHKNEDPTLTHILTRGFKMKTKATLAGVKNLFKKPSKNAIPRCLQVFGSDHFPIKMDLNVI